MKFGKFAIAVAVGLGLLGGVTSGAVAQTLKIGVIGPLTGGGAAFGNSAAEATRIVAAETNAKGGLEVGGKKYHVEVIAYDDQYKASDAIAAYNRLINQDGVKYVVTVTSPANLALAPSIEADKTIVITSAGVPAAVNPKSRYMFRITSLVRDFLPAVVGWVADNMKGRRVAIINPNDEAGWYSTDISKSAFQNHGFEIVDRELFERSAKEFGPMLTKIVAINPDLIDLASTPPATCGLIVRQARELGYKGVFVKDNGAAVTEVLDAAGKEGAEGMISQHYADPRDPAFRRLADTYKKDIGLQPDNLIVAYYDGVSAVLRAIQKAGDVSDTAKVSDAIFTKTFPIESVTGGELRLGGNGGPGDPNQILTWSYISVVKNGEPVIVGKVR